MHDELVGQRYLGDRSMPYRRVATSSDRVGCDDSEVMQELEMGHIEG